MTDWRHGASRGCHHSVVSALRENHAVEEARISAVMLVRLQKNDYCKGPRKDALVWKSCAHVNRGRQACQLNLAGASYCAGGIDIRGPRMRIALLSFALLSSAAAQAQTIDLHLTQTTALPSITEIANAHDGSGRLFLVQQTGQIRILRNGQLLDTPFLDISAAISSGGERGLLGLAFAPDYASSGRFYIYYTAPNGDVTIARVRVGGSPDRADPASREVLLTIPHSTYANHNGGKLAFGPDRFLYAGVGDGGGGGDPLHSGQSTGTLLAKLLRIDVSPATGYAIPASNPLRGINGANPELWAIGLRNPWRFSFDRATGDLYIADVGQNKVEEIDFQPASDKGGENSTRNLCDGNIDYSSSA